jgi:hypothetical protein
MCGVPNETLTSCPPGEDLTAESGVNFRRGGAGLLRLPAFGLAAFFLPLPLVRLTLTCFTQPSTVVSTIFGMCSA